MPLDDPKFERELAEEDERIQPLAKMPHNSYAPPVKDEPALRYDSGKVCLADFDAFFDPGFMEEIGKVLRYGAKKYGRDNWKKGMSWSRCFNSFRRHGLAWWRGETIDDESGCHHLALLVCSIMFLFVYERENLGTDDRRAA